MLLLGLILDYYFKEYHNFGLRQFVSSMSGFINEEWANGLVFSVMRSYLGRDLLKYYESDSSLRDF